MKKVIIIIAVLLLFPSLSFATNYLIDANCELAWDCSEGSGTSLGDTSSNSNTGTFKGSGEPAWDAGDVSFDVSGQADNSLDFDDVDDYVTASDHASIQMSDAVSVVCYVEPDDAQAWGCIAGKPAGASHVDPYYDYAILQNGGTPSGSAQFRVESDYATSATGEIPTGSFTFVACAWDKDEDSGDLEMYFDGAETSYYGADTKTSAITDGGQDFRLGTGVDGTSDVYDGHNTYSAVFSRKLSSTEINEIHDYGLTGNPGAGRRMFML